MYDTGYPVSIDHSKEGCALIFHAGTISEKGQLKTSGGRVFAVSALGDTLEEAVKFAYDGFNAIHFQRMYFREDIAKAVLERDCGTVGTRD
ncbi:hypothetical protein ONS96_004769 [Cadophora gregata f. sp. sojae]|nr:hypothetical protein ONS96_004769 [Cadophora gregata f. sp. sojae]